MSVITFPVLRYAVAVALHGSFSAAARACGVSQPTVSNAVAELEQALGARLFERSTRRLALTPAGEALLPRAGATLDALAELEQAARSLKSPSRKLLRVGFSSLIRAQRLALLFEPFQKQKPDVELIYKECSLGDMEARLDKSTVDVVCGIGFARTRNRGRHVLYREALRYVAPHALVSADRVTLRDVARHRLVLTDGSCGLAPATRALFARARIPIDEYAGHAISYAALEEWAELGIGGAILPASHIRKARSAALDAADKPIVLTYEVVWRRDLLVAQHAKAFVDYLRTVVTRLGRGISEG